VDTHLTGGYGTMKFHMVNMRGVYQFGFFKGSKEVTNQDASCLLSYMDFKPACMAFAGSYTEGGGGGGGYLHRTALLMSYT
jgi:hypothetical protein